MYYIVVMCDCCFNLNVFVFMKCALGRLRWFSPFVIYSRLKTPSGARKAVKGGEEQLVRVNSY